MAAKQKVAILISGSGSNLQSLIDAAQQDDYPAKITLVISNRPKAYGLERATKAGIATAMIDHKSYEDRPEFEEAIQAALHAASIDIVCLAGFMRVLTPNFVTKWSGRILNIHPSLLPSFKGLHVHQQALDAGVKIAGCTVHVVTPELDDGPIIGQAAVPVLDDDTAETLTKRILVEEHKLYPKSLRDFIEKELP